MSDRVSIMSSNDRVASHTSLVRVCLDAFVSSGWVARGPSGELSGHLGHLNPTQPLRVVAARFLPNEPQAKQHADS